MLLLYNTLTKKKEEFTPLHDKTVGLYTCGPTVYNYAHIGNLRTFIFEDILKRVLQHNGFSVNHVMNITDVGHLTSDADEGEDKLEKGARREGKTAWEIAEFYTRAFKKDLADLHIIPPTRYTKATDHIKEQIAWIEKLKKKGMTYKTSDGIYYDTSKFRDYGKLSGQNLAALKEGARVEKNPEKKNPTDFALWKFSPADAQRDMEWESPWGKGFPGWHLECSVMAQKYLGETLDIHCGGVDLIPTHHTNEIAQAEAVTGKPFSRVWMHGEFIVLKNNEKMSKSSDNFLTLKNLEEKGFDPIAYRYFTFSAHYRQKLNFSLEVLEAAQKTLERLRSHIHMWDAPDGGCADFEQRFFDAVNDDLNMPQALAVMWEMIKSENPSSDKHQSIIRFDTILGLGLAGIQPLQIPNEVRELAKKREAARATKNFGEADDLREKMSKKGFAVDDTPEGFVIKKL